MVKSHRKLEAYLLTHHYHFVERDCFSWNSCYPELGKFSLAKPLAGSVGHIRSRYQFRQRCSCWQYFQRDGSYFFLLFCLLIVQKLLQFFTLRMVIVLLRKCSPTQCQAINCMWVETDDPKLVMLETKVIGNKAKDYSRHIYVYKFVHIVLW